jgi:signal peptidase II
MVPQKYLLIVSISGMLISLDQLTKFLVLIKLKVGDSIPVIHNYFHVTFNQNSGLAFGILAGSSSTTKDLFFLLGPSIFLCAIFYLFAKLRETQIATIYAYCFIVGGALGNLLDRIRTGYVVDFLDFHFQGKWHFPTFNIADCSISFGIFLLFLGLFLDRESRIE